MKKKLINNKLLSGILILVLGVTIISCNTDQENIDMTGNEEFLTVDSEMITLIESVLTKSETGAQCVEFQYPVVFYYILPSSTHIEAAVINSDEEFITFFDFVKDVDSIRLDFPITLMSSDNEIIEIPDMESLTQTLQTAVEACLGIGDFEFCGSLNTKVYICHNGNTLCVSASAIQAHLDHGDVLGQCD